MGLLKSIDQTTTPSVTPQLGENQYDRLFHSRSHLYDFFMNFLDQLYAICF